jgi:ankyrin repeat protein
MSGDAALHALLTLIAARDQPSISRRLAESPSLASAALMVGATRQSAMSYYFEKISNHAYAGDTALHFAAAAHLPTVARQLLALGASVDARNRNGAEPLHYAADGSPGSDAWDPESQVGIIDLLIGAGADPNAQDKRGVTPLHRAVRTRCAGAVDALLERGADPIRKNGSGSTPLHLAVRSTGRGGSGSAAARDGQRELIQILLRRGARPSDRDAAGRTVRECATADWILALLSRG